MGSRTVCGAKKFIDVLSSLHDQTGNTSCLIEEDIQISKVHGEENALLTMLSSNQAILICQKAAPKFDRESEVQSIAETSNCSENGDDLDPDKEHDGASLLKSEPEPLPLTVNQARRLVSFYTLAQNPRMALGDDRTLLPLWVHCDMLDPAGTTWLGAEMVCTGSKATGIKLYSVTCKGSTVGKKSFMTLEDVKKEHRKRHPSAPVALKGTARYNLFDSTVVENTTIKSQSSVTVDLKWNDVGRILETPPMSSTATLNIKVASGDMRNPMFELYREIEFLQSLADGLRTEEINWLEPVETTSAVNLTKAYLEELQNDAKTQHQTVKPTKPAKTPSENADEETPTFTSLLVRGDLDFIEQLWVRLRKSVTSYQDIGDSLKLVIDAFRYGSIKPWIHRDSNSSLSKLVLQSYHQKIDNVHLSGMTPVQMLLEMGLDKMRKDYINYLIAEELTTLNHLHYFLSTDVDIQEQVVRLRKLHHLLEIIVTCTTFLGLPYHSLFQLTQSCLQHYKTNPYNESYNFELPVKPALISHFYQKELPVMWGVEVSSGHGPREVRTLLQLSDRPLVDHVVFETDYQNETVNGASEDPAYFSTLVCCSLNSFA
uniref:Protein zwilch n=1 Tax=Neogobius melanostomus TaxID=47308 RepID=A0A8C6WKD7_9GOBI